MAIFIAIAGLWGIWRGLVQRRHEHRRIAAGLIQRLILHGDVVHRDAVLLVAANEFREVPGQRREILLQPFGIGAPESGDLFRGGIGIDIFLSGRFGRLMAVDGE